MKNKGLVKVIGIAVLSISMIIGSIIGKSIYERNKIPSYKFELYTKDNRVVVYYGEYIKGSAEGVMFNSNGQDYYYKGKYRVIQNK